MPEQTGRHVLVVEDESTVLMLVEDMLEDLGFTVDSAMQLSEAMPIARSAALDLAILDINLGEERSYPIADALSARGIPFVFATGYGSKGLDPAYRGFPVVQKPFRRQDLAAAVKRVLQT